MGNLWFPVDFPLSQPIEFRSQTSIIWTDESRDVKESVRGENRREEKRREEKIRENKRK